MTMALEPVFVAAAVRTPIGSFGGALRPLSAVDLGVAALKGALERSKIPANLVEEVFFGNVLAANNGQNPARQISIRSGIPNTVPATTVNKVCASGMKAVELAALTIASGNAHIVVAGGTESMSNTPFYLTTQRWGTKFGHQQMVDGIVRDGLWDMHNNFVMGEAAEICAKEHDLSRVAQDDYAISTYTRAQEATKAGLFADEIVPVEVSAGKGATKTIRDDEGVFNLNVDKLRAMKPAFITDGTGTVTAPNSSPLNDGAAVLILVSASKAAELGITPIAKILSYADAAREPERFTIAPSLAVPKALARAGLSTTDVDYFELNEAFSVVALANMKLMNLPADRVNAFGGAVALGHPLGCSGARILVTLINVLKKKGGKRGVAGICNGGGGASAVVLEAC